MSLVNVSAEEAEWRTRKINLFSLLRGFLSQISPGQDLTKVLFLRGAIVLIATFVSFPCVSDPTFSVFFSAFY
jgi:hypothetical protein